MSTIGERMGTLLDLRPVFEEKRVIDACVRMAHATDSAVRPTARAVETGEGARIVFMPAARKALAPKPRTRRR